MKMNSTLTNSTFSGSDSALLYIPYFQVCILIAIFGLGLPLYLYVVFLMVSKCRVMEVSADFTLNHIIAEFIFSVNLFINVLVVFYFNFYTTYLSDFIYGTMMCARSIFQCCVCLEQYLAVLHPLIFLKLKPLRYRLRFSIFVWIIAVALGAIFGTGLLPFYKVFAVFYPLVLAVELFCCVSVLKDLRHPGPGDRERDRMSAAKRKAFQVMIINLVSLIIQNLPFAVSFSLENVVCDFFLALEISIIVNFLGGFVQPLFLLHRAGKLSFTICAKKRSALISRQKFCS